MAVDFSDAYRRFLAYIPAGGRILDVGCGSGRDAKAFRDRGYKAVGLDAAGALAGITDAGGAKIIEAFEPRGAQIEALYALGDSRAEGATKGLVQAATGVGKTYLAAFDSRDFRRVLFVAHREEILRQAARSFCNVRKSKDYGFFNGNTKDMDKAVIFASVCPIDLHCSYNTNQIMAAFGYYNEEAAPEFREGVKYFKEKDTDIFLINLNKSEKDFSPSTMYEDYAVNSTLFHWESQSQDREQSPKIQRYIHHREHGGLISLFVREFKKNGSYTAPYIFLGNADYVNHQGEQPVGFNWQLHAPIPSDLLPKANKTIAV